MKKIILDTPQRTMYYDTDYCPGIPHITRQEKIGNRKENHYNLYNLGADIKDGGGGFDTIPLYIDYKAAYLKIERCLRRMKKI